LGRHRDALAGLGLGLCAISYDTVEILRVFAGRRGITFPMLADPDSTVIRRFGLLNEAAAPGSRDEGMAHPAVLLVDRDGVVRERFQEERYYHRLTTPAVLARLGAAAAVEGVHARGAHVDVRVAATDRAVHPGNRVTLYVDVTPERGVHVYGPGVAGGYRGLSVEIDAPPFLTVYPARYPAARPLALPWTDEPLIGYTESVRVAVDVALGTRQEMAVVLDAGAGLTLTGTVALQACDDRVCWPPDVIRVAWHFDLIPPDLIRAPETWQHTPRA
jgi:hypothetical protein